MRACLRRADRACRVALWRCQGKPERRLGLVTRGGIARSAAGEQERSDEAHPDRPTPVPPGAKPYDWDAATGLARRFIPGQPNGMHTVTGLAHDRLSHVAYDSDSNEQSLRARSLKLAEQTH